VRGKLELEPRDTMEFRLWEGGEEGGIGGRTRPIPGRVGEFGCSMCDVDIPDSFIELRR